jgi:hypothetical protein
MSWLVLPAGLAAFLVFLHRLDDWRKALLAAAVSWGILVVLISEILSACNALAFAPLAIAWAVAGTAACALAWRLGMPRLNRLSRPRPLEIFWICSIAAIFLLAAATALLCPPNNWDSMSYHMARVSNWFDHRSLRNYPTSDVRQLFLSPWTELAILQTQILSSGDRFANCVQWTASIFSIIAASLAARMLGAAPRGQVLAAVLCATIPMGILQASTTQNDACAAFWLVCFLCAVLSLIGDSQNPRSMLFIAGGSLGLGMLTKMTMAMYAAPFCIWLAIVLLKRRKLHGFGAIALIGVLAIVINLPHFIRNDRTFGSPLGSVWQREKLQNFIQTPAAITSNAIRNIAIHFAMPWGNQTVNRATLAIHRALAPIDISDSRTTFLARPFEVAYALDESSAGNPLHVIIAVVCLAVAIFRPRAPRTLKIYALCLIAGFFLLCAQLRWQPWSSRFELPWFVVAAPLCAYILQTNRAFRIGANSVVIPLLALGLYTVLFAVTRPLVGSNSIFRQDRASLYFLGRPEIRRPFMAAASQDFGVDPVHVGLIAGQDDWEYPLRLLIRQRWGNNIVFEHIAVRMERKPPPPDDPAPHGPPEFIVEFGPLGREPQGYQPIYQSNPINVLKKSPAG